MQTLTLLLTPLLHQSTILSGVLTRWLMNVWLASVYCSTQRQLRSSVDLSALLLVFECQCWGWSMLLQRLLEKRTTSHVSW